MKKAAVLILCCVLGGAGAAEARRKKAPRKRYRPNMPAGWSWPPNEEMKRDGAECLQKLDAIGLKWQAAKPTRKIATPVVVPDMEFGGVKFEPIWRKPPFVMDCHLALALATSAGPALRSIAVKQVNFYGIYQYRNVKGTKILSRHSLGLAMDAGSFVTDDGAVHGVKGDYERGDSVLVEAEHLINATGAFRILLTPGNDPRRHSDHFHFEARTPRDRQVHIEKQNKQRQKDRRS